MKSRARSRAIRLGRLVTVFLLIAVSTKAEAPPDNVEYDIVRYHDSLTIWLNLNRYLGETEFQSLREGIGYGLQWEVSLQRPRKLWGAETVTETASGLTIARRPVTEDFEILTPTPDSATARHIFLTRTDLRRYLSDSVLITLLPIDSLTPQPRYQVKLVIQRISLTSLNLAADGESPGTDTSPLKFLFRQFLTLTGYGRDEFSTTSRSFRLTEVDSIR